MEVRKRTHIETSPNVSFKRAKYDYICLESDDFLSSSDFESVDSLQDKETDFVKDTSDMSDSAASEYEPITTDEEAFLFDCSSSSGMEDIVGEQGYVTIFETSLNAWATDCEDSDSSSGSAYELRDFRNCIQCKSENSNPQFRYCERCFQQRKSTFPPRPRPNKPKKEKNNENSDGADSGSTFLSQDSGIGKDTQKAGENSSQELTIDDVKKIINGQELLVTTTSQDTIIATKNKIAISQDTITNSQNAIENSQDTIIDRHNMITSSQDTKTTSKETIAINQDTITTSQDTVTTSQDQITDQHKISSKEEDTEVGKQGTETDKHVTEIGEDSQIDNQEIKVESRIIVEKEIIVENKQISSEETITSSQEVLTINQDTMNDKQLSETVKKESPNENVLTNNQKPLMKNKERIGNRKRKREDESLLNTNELPAKMRLVTGLNEEKELCIICNNNMKNSIFLHGSIAHMCCCYKCSIKTWKINKRCPMCNCVIKNVVKVFKS